MQVISSQSGYSEMWKGGGEWDPPSHTSAKHQGHTHRATERPRLVAKLEGTQTLTTRLNQIQFLRVARQKTILVTRLHSVHVRELLWRPSSHVKHLPRGVNMCVLTCRQSRPTVQSSIVDFSLITRFRSAAIDDRSWSRIHVLFFAKIP